jgi:hypothetical protein
MIKLQRQVEELSYQLIEMKKKKLKDRVESYHKSMVIFENLFQRRKRRNNFLIGMSVWEIMMI